jgi:hypothetical protein
MQFNFWGISEASLKTNLWRTIMAHGFTVYLEQYQSISIQLAPIRDEE